MIQGLVRAVFRAENAAKNRKELAAGIWGWGINRDFWPEYSPLPLPPNFMKITTHHTTIIAR